MESSSADVQVDVHFTYDASESATTRFERKWHPCGIPHFLALKSKNNFLIFLANGLLIRTIIGNIRKLVIRLHKQQLDGTTRA